MGMVRLIMKRLSLPQVPTIIENRQGPISHYKGISRGMPMGFVFISSINLLTREDEAKMFNQSGTKYSSKEVVQVEKNGSIYTYMFVCACMNKNKGKNERVISQPNHQQIPDKNASMTIWRNHTDKRRN